MYLVGTGNDSDVQKFIATGIFTKRMWKEGAKRVA